LVLNVGGHLHGQSQPTDASMRVLVVQPNIGNEEKLAAEKNEASSDQVVDRLQHLTAKGLDEHGPVDFVVWPETAFPELMNEPSLLTGYPSRLRHFVAGTNTKLITGGYSQLESTGQVTNSFFVLSGKGEWLLPPYHKTVLLAFGEYLPGAGFIPGLHDLLPQVGNFGRGPGPTVLDTGEVRIGAQICYEGLFDWFSREQAHRGAQVLVNLTNDAWYGAWQQPYQHLYMTLARAIEVRRPLVRSTNTGISAAILGSGEILQQSPTYEGWYHTYEIPFVRNPPATLFMGFGSWLLPGALFLVLMLLVGTCRTARQAFASPTGTGLGPCTSHAEEQQVRARRPHKPS
jgi:apolipoprotein N-acyltransferase